MFDSLRHRPYSIRTKLLLAVMFVVLTPLLGTALYGNWFTSDLIKHQAVSAAYGQLDRRAQQIESYLSGNKNDLRYLVHLHSLDQYLDAEDAETKRYWQQQLARDFLIFASAHPDYYQVRYLNAEGMEIARVDTQAGRTYIVPTERLQNKAHRYYFVEGAKLAPGDIYISPLDLNREFGKLEQPLHPVIRYVTPVYRGGAFRGVIVINVEGEAILHFVESPHNALQILMVDQDGYYLMHPQEEKRWGGPTDLHTGESVVQDFPSMASNILSGRSGDVVANRKIIIYTPIHYWSTPPQRFWVLIQVAPVNVLLAPLHDFRLTAGLILIAAIVMATIMTYALAQNFTEPVLALQQGVQRLAQGDFAEQIAITSHDEIGQLTEAFNEMAQMIRTYLDQMDKLQRLGLRISAHVDREEILALMIDTIRELLPVEEERIFCLTTEKNEMRYQVVATGEQGASQRDHPLNEAWLIQASQHQIGKVTQYHQGDKVICYAPLRVSASRRAVVELVGDAQQMLDPWHCKLFSSLVAQGSIALENADLYQRLAHHRQQLQHLVNALIAAQEEERRVVAYDIHDGLLQYLVAARLLLRNYASMVEKAPETARDLLEAGMEQVGIAISEGRRIIEGMRPILLDDLGLEAAVREVAVGMARRADWDLELDMNLNHVPIAPETEIAAFRIIQEALTNAYKYAQGQRVLVKLGIEDETLTLLIRDWGQGFDLQDVNAAYGHVGLVAMQERARLVGGVCTITSRPGEGVQVFVRLPLNVEAGGLEGYEEDTRDHC